MQRRYIAMYIYNADALVIYLFMFSFTVDMKKLGGWVMCCTYSLELKIYLYEQANV